MSGLLSRFTTFLPNATILSNDHNQEFNRIVQLLNGMTTNLKTVLKTSDAGDAPLELDQLSTGPILKGFQGGIEKFRVGNNGGLTIFDANPSITFDDTAGTDAKIHHDASVLRLGSASVDHLLIDVSTGIVTFAQIPVGPASDPTTNNQLARKLYVDGRQTRWSANWFIADPSTFPLNSFNLAQKVLIPSANFTALEIGAIFNTGSASGSFSIEIRKHPFSDQSAQTTLGTITVNPGTLGVGITVNIADHNFSNFDYIYVTLTARSSPLQRDVSIYAMGHQTPV